MAVLAEGMIQTGRWCVGLEAPNFPDTTYSFGGAPPIWMDVRQDPGANPTPAILAHVMALRYPLLPAPGFIIGDTRAVFSALLPGGPPPNPSQAAALRLPLTELHHYEAVLFANRSLLGFQPGAEWEVQDIAAHGIIFNDAIGDFPPDFNLKNAAASLRMKAIRDANGMVAALLIYPKDEYAERRHLAYVPFMCLDSANPERCQHLSDGWIASHMGLLSLADLADITHGPEEDPTVEQLHGQLAGSSGDWSFMGHPRPPSVLSPQSKTITAKKPHPLLTRNVIGAKPPPPLLVLPFEPRPGAFPKPRPPSASRLLVVR